MDSDRLSTAEKRKRLDLAGRSPRRSEKAIRIQAKVRVSIYKIYSIFSILGRFCIEILCFFQQYSVLKRYESSVSDREQHDTVREQSIVKRQFTPRVVKILLTAKMSTSFMTIYACVPECNGASENSENDVSAQLLIYRREKDWTHHPVVFNGETINLLSQKLYC